MENVLLYIYIYIYIPCWPKRGYPLLAPMGGSLNTLICLEGYKGQDIGVGVIGSHGPMVIGQSVGQPVGVKGQSSP